VLSPGTLYLVPVPLLEESGLRHIPAHNLGVISTLRVFIAEDAKTARKNLKLFGYKDLNVEILLLNEHTEASEIPALLGPLLNGQDVGLMSDAGCPGVADPGSAVVRLCHQKKIRVSPLGGPSSILFSVMASGFNSQSFAFNGYLPVDKPQRVKKLRELEGLAAKDRQAQFFIETPYRNLQLLETMLVTLSPETLVFIGSNIGGRDERLVTVTVENLRKGALPALNKVPAVFGIFR
jgi:16S rRNA (cytidine1402-2'-O)-methyltransferase